MKVLASETRAGAVAEGSVWVEILELKEEASERPYFWEPRAAASVGYGAQSVGEEEDR